jgi:hypothetical protein
VTTVASRAAGGPALRTIGDPAGNLAAHLGHHGLGADDLRAQVGPAFGPPGLVVASGSVVVGYANVRSDIDLYVVGDVLDTQRVPVVSYELGPLLDINLLPAAELRTELGWIREEPRVVAAGGSPARKWRRAGRILDRATRLAYGVVLEATPEWLAVQQSLGTGWLAERTATWWRLEAHRRLLVAGWLAPVKPALAAQLGCEARLCALKAVAAADGYAYFNQKWLAKELRQLQRPDLLVSYRQALRLAWDEDPRIAETAAMVDDLTGGPPADLIIEVAYARGVSTRTIGDATLVDRWEMRGALLTEPEIPVAARDGGAVWTGPIGEVPPDWLVGLLARGLVWTGVAHAAH